LYWAPFYVWFKQESSDMSDANQSRSLSSSKTSSRLQVQLHSQCC
jgi:hypothetical protein